MISSFRKKSGSHLADSRCGLGCNLFLNRRLLRCGLLIIFDRRRCLRSLFDDPVELGYTRFMQLLSTSAFGFLFLLFPLELLFPFFGFPLLFLLVLLSLLFIVALAFLGLFLCLGFGRGFHRRGWIGGLFFCRSWIVYRAVVIRAYGESGSYALAIDDDCGLSGCTRPCRPRRLGS